MTNDELKLIAESDVELDGFAEEPLDIDGDEEAFRAFNICLASDYIDAFYNEDLSSLGEIYDRDLSNIIYWGSLIEPKEKIDKLKNGEFKTKKGKTIIDFIYENNLTSLAASYLNARNIYNPKLVLTVILNEGYNAYITPDEGITKEELEKRLDQFYEFVKNEIKKSDNKKEFIEKIRKSLSKIKLRVPEEDITEKMKKKKNEFLKYLVY